MRVGSTRLEALDHAGGEKFNPLADCKQIAYLFAMESPGYAFPRNSTERHLNIVRRRAYVVVSGNRSPGGTGQTGEHHMTQGQTQQVMAIVLPGGE